MGNVEDPLSALENIPIDCHSKEVQNYKLALSDKLPRMEKLLTMYKFKDMAFHGRISPTLQRHTTQWVMPQIQLTEQFINETKRIIQECDKPTFNSSNILDYLENLHVFREEQRRINKLAEGTNPVGPMTTLQIESMHLTNNLLKVLNIIDLPNEEQLPTPPVSP